MLSDQKHAEAKLVYDNNKTWEILQICESRKVGNLQTFIENFT